AAWRTSGPGSARTSPKSCGWWPPEPWSRGSRRGSRSPRPPPRSLSPSPAPSSARSSSSPSRETFPSRKSSPRRKTAHPHFTLPEVHTMNVAAPATPIPAAELPSANKADNRPGYIGFAAAFLFGHGTAALSKGADPVLSLPAWVPLTLLGVGIVTGLVLIMKAGARAGRGADRSEQLAEKLVGTSWVTGFVALALAITGVATAFDLPELQDVLWPAGSVLVVGLINLAEGAVRRNTLHYGLGTWLTLIASASLFLDT